MKVVINTCYGGFSISKKAHERLLELGSDLAIKDQKWRDERISEEEDLPEWDIVYRYFNYHHNLAERADPLLIQVLEEMGREAWGEHSELEIIDIPDDIVMNEGGYIDDYDGRESVHENHRSW